MTFFTILSNFHHIFKLERRLDSVVTSRLLQNISEEKSHGKSDAREIRVTELNAIVMNPTIGPGSFEQKCCLPDHINDYAITCNDAYGDGWHGGYLEINGEKYCANFERGHKMFDILPNKWYNREGMIISTINQPKFILYR